MCLKNLFLISLFLLLCQCAIAQEGTLSGTVMQKDGTSSLVGANVYISGTTIGTVTNKHQGKSIQNFKIHSLYL